MCYEMSSLEQKLVKKVFLDTQRKQKEYLLIRILKCEINF